MGRHADSFVWSPHDEMAVTRWTLIFADMESITAAAEDQPVLHVTVFVENTPTPPTPKKTTYTKQKTLFIAIQPKKA